MHYFLIFETLKFAIGQHGQIGTLRPCITGLLRGLLHYASPFPFFSDELFAISKCRWYEGKS